MIVQFSNTTDYPVRLVRISLAQHDPAVQVVSTKVYNAAHTGGFPAEQIGDLPKECRRSYVPSPVNSLTVKPHEYSHWFAAVAIRITKPGRYVIRQIRIDYSTPSGTGWQYWSTSMTLRVSDPPLPGPDKLLANESC